MDRALLERMIGAATLVLLVVILAPAALDGTGEPAAPEGGVDAEDRTRTEVIVLNKPVDAVQPSARVASRDLERVEPAAGKAEAPAREERPAPPANAPAPAATPETGETADTKPAPPAKARADADAPPSPRRPPGGYAVQLGSFSEASNAERFAGSIGQAGFPVFVVRGAARQGPVYRVYAGPRPTRDEAEAMSGKLRAKGHNGLIVDLGNHGN